VRPTRDPAGTVVTRSAGLVEFSATLSFRRPEDVPEGPTLEISPQAARCCVIETDDITQGRREILGEILALSEDDLGSALETILRSLAIAAALSDAVLQTRTARVTPVRAAPAAAFQALALDVRGAGFPVRFAPTWTPLAEGEIGLGISGSEQKLRDFIEAHPSWCMPRTPRHSRESGNPPHYARESRPRGWIAGHIQGTL
jgi:hypothetical protein